MSRERAWASPEHDVAVVGMAGRFPGARNIDEFWTNVRDGRESITEFSDAELRSAGVSEELLTSSRYVKRAPILAGVECFDAEFFGISPRDAAIMDPQHRHFLECAWEALEHAGHPPERFDGNIAVFAGSGQQSYLIHNVLTHASLVDAVGSFGVHYTGNEKDVLATRASYQFNLTGPSVTVQTACSTSLVAIHLACSSLLGEECDLALAGGVTIWVPHRVGYLYREGEIRSRDGRCRPFAAEADGTTFGSGVGVVALRRLGDALRDRDCIYAVIRGSAVNNDGSQKAGYFAPSVQGQALAVAEALGAAGVDPESIGFVETHGTGTRIGDPIEIASLTEVYRVYTGRKEYCALGSVKANVGHLDAAAGVAGFIKAVQVLVHGQLPPLLHFREPNPAIDFTTSPFHVNTELRAWERRGIPRRAAVNSLGIGGTNAHVILEEAPPRPSSGPSRDWQLLVLSARNRSVLEKATDNLVRHLEQHPEQDLADVAYTLQLGRRGMGERRIAVCRDREDAVRALAARERGRVETQTSADDRRVVFLFTGQGSQYVNMGRGLYEKEPHFREPLDRCAELLKTPLGCDIREVLYPAPARADAATATLRGTATAQPALFALEYALASLWRSWGVEPAAMIGHSLGEYVAACLAGVFRLEDALDLVALRGRLMQEQPPGSMLAVLRGEHEVREWLGGSVALAAVNAPEVCVVSGPSEEVEDLRIRLEERSVLCRPLHVSHAFHSPMMEPILAPFTEAVRSVELSPPRIPFASDVSGDWISDAQAVDPAYWGTEHIRKPVRFAEGLERISRGKPAVLLEVGPGTALTALARQSADPSTAPVFVSSLPNPKEETQDLQVLLGALGRVWMAGVPVDWNGLHAEGRRNRVALPTYPFEPVKHWLEPSAATGTRPRSVPTGRPALEDWFHQPAWRPALRPRLEQGDGSPDPQERVAVFADGCGIGDAVASRLRERGHDVVLVRSARAFSERGDHELAMDPGSKPDMDQVVERLFRAGRPPRYLLHLWNVSAAADGSTARGEDLSLYSLLHLAQALARRDRGGPLHLTVVSSGMQQVAGEPLPDPTKALLLGPCKVIPCEIPDFSCRSIDIVPPEPGGWQWNDLVEALAAEVLTRGGDEVVAYRGSERRVEAFERVRLPAGKASRSAFRRGGTYLVTGGLGGIGLVLAEHLVRGAGANVVLAGRSALPPADEWDAWLATHDPEDPTSVRIRKIRELESAGGSVSVLEVDAADPAQIREAVDHARRRFGALHGVFHLAGVLDDGLIELKTKDAVEALLRPKVQGTRSLLDALDGIPLDFVVLFSSLSSVVGLAGQVDYAAANAFLNAFARHKHSLDGTPIVAIDWGMWEEVGMAADRFQSRESMSSREIETRTTEVGVRTHWVLNEHRRKDGVAVMPGTGYIDLARSAFAGDGAWAPFEIRDVFFLTPMAIHGEERRSLRLQLEGDRSGARFSFASRRAATDEDEDWHLHTTGAIRRMEVGAPASCDLQAIVERCADRAALERREPEHHFWSFGPRWASLKEIHFGRAEALLVLEMPAEFEAELDEYPIHPALLDMATGELVTQFSDSSALFVPFSYGAIRGYRPLDRLLYCHVRYRQESLRESPVAAFDVTIANERGEILAEVDRFLMRRVEGQQTDFGEEPRRDAADVVQLRPRGGRADGGTSELFRYGIRPEQGTTALERILLQPGLTQIIVSPVDLDALRAANREAAGVMETRSTGSAAAGRGADAAPGDAAAVIKSLWREALGIEDIREDDEFFALGGHSLTLVQVSEQLRRRFGLELSLSDLIEQPTVSGWTRLLSGARAAGSGSPED